MILILFFKFLSLITFDLFLVYRTNDGGEIYRFFKKLFIFKSDFSYCWILNKKKPFCIPAQLTILNKNNDLLTLNVHFDFDASKREIYQKILDFEYEHPFKFLNIKYHQKVYNQLKNKFKDQSLKFKTNKILCNHYGFFHYLSLTIESRDNSDLMLLMSNTGFKIFDGDIFQDYNFSSIGKSKEFSNDIFEISNILKKIDIYSNQHAPEICYGLNNSDIEVMYFSKDKFYKASFYSFYNQISFVEINLETLETLTLQTKDISLKKFIKDLSVIKISESPKGFLYEKLNELGIYDNLITDDYLTVLDMFEY